MSSFNAETRTHLGPYFNHLPRQPESSTICRKVTGRVAALLQPIEMILVLKKKQFYLWKCLRFHHISKNSTFPWADVKSKRAGFRSAEFRKHQKMFGYFQSYDFLYSYIFPSANMYPQNLANEFCTGASYQLASYLETWERLVPNQTILCDISAFCHLTTPAYLLFSFHVFTWMPSEPRKGCGVVRNT